MRRWKTLEVGGGWLVDGVARQLSRARDGGARRGERLLDLVNELREGIREWRARGAVLASGAGGGETQHDAHRVHALGWYCSCGPGRLPFSKNQFFPNTKNTRSTLPVQKL
jgi:hypothetical protein